MLATYGVILGSAVRTVKLAWTSISMELVTLKGKGSMGEGVSRTTVTMLALQVGQ